MKGQSVKNDRAVDREGMRELNILLAVLDLSFIEACALIGVMKENEIARLRLAFRIKTETGWGGEYRRKLLAALRAPQAADAYKIS
jgi:hypothetical protein